MLVLRRKKGETVVIGGNILVTILEVEGERVKVGISAPPAVSIVREELLCVVQIAQPTVSAAPQDVLPSMPQPPLSSPPLNSSMPSDSHSRSPQKKQ